MARGEDTGWHPSRRTFRITPENVRPGQSRYVEYDEDSDDGVDAIKDGYVYDPDHHYQHRWSR